MDICQCNTTTNQFAFKQAEEQLEISLRKLKIDDMVREQVDSFPVAVLEDLVLGISRREFKMITVLGAVLGGADWNRTRLNCLCNKSYLGGNKK